MKKKPKRREPVKRKKEVTAKEIMNPEVVTVGEDMTLQELATFLTEREISGAPVTNERGKLVGVVSLTDIALSAAESGEAAPPATRPGARTSGWETKLNPDDLRQMHIENAGRAVRDIMTPTVYTIPDSTPVSKIARTMISGRVHRLLVTHGKRIVGIVTTLDMLKLLA